MTHEEKYAAAMSRFDGAPGGTHVGAENQWSGVLSAVGALRAAGLQAEIDMQPMSDSVILHGPLFCTERWCRDRQELAGPVGSWYWAGEQDGGELLTLALRFFGVALPEAQQPPSPTIHHPAAVSRRHGA